MQKILLILLLFPFVSTAQINTTSNKTIPLLESITSDTINGTCKAIVFEYDQLKRVSRISVKEISIKKRSASLETLIKVQDFKYQQNEQIPFASHIFNYDYEDIRLSRERNGQSQQLQYFLIKDGKRIGDSVIYQDYEHLVADAKFDDTISQKRIASFVQTPTKLISVLGLSEKEPGIKYPRKYFIDSFVINKEHNIGFESSEQHDGDRFFPRAYFTFTKFDQAINPLQQLNIAPLVTNEKITLSFGSDQMKQIGKCIDHFGTEFNWHYLNQNNPMNLYFERGEVESPFEDIIQLSYSYNQDQQPTYCKTLVKKIFKNDNGRLAGTYKKSFTFRYKK
ncbi:MAG: hypothetical protein CFE25_06900 [Chitinophagaceae bacterium BSSC1]|nr:MAG: hypothetical protein CFE25_06900 [Chitinophagaceae bacterium BSSC1]